VVFWLDTTFYNNSNSGPGIRNLLYMELQFPKTCILTKAISRVVTIKILFGSQTLIETLLDVVAKYLTKKNFFARKLRYDNSTRKLCNDSLSA
jgi:hypothetical protein